MEGLNRTILASTDDAELSDHEMDCDQVCDQIIYDDLENAEDLGADDVNEFTTIEEIIQKNVSGKIRSLKQFFSSNNFVTEKGDQKTNIINVAEKKTHNIPPTHIEDYFINLDDCRRENRMLHYSERQETADKLKTGIMIDFDRYQRSKDPQINDRHFESLTRHITKLLVEFVDFSLYALDGKFVFRIGYIRKPAVVPVEQKLPSDIPLYKDGFHILIPELWMTKGFKRYLSSELCKRGIIKNVFKDIDHIEAPEKMLDMMSASNPVHFLGNSKPTKPAYKLTHVYEVTIYTEEDDVEKKLLDIEQINSGMIKIGKDTEPTPINLTYEFSLGFRMDMFSGKKTWMRKIEIDYRPQLETKIQLIVEKTSKDIIPEDDLLQSENSVDILTVGDARAMHLKRLLEILDISYATEYEKWFKVICAIAHTSLNYKPLAVFFSHRRPESWSPAEIERVWAEATNGRFGRKPVTMRSVIHWARESSPARYKEIDKEHYFQVLARGAYDNEGRVEHALAAKVCHSMVGDKFVVDVGYNDRTGKTGYCWYEFVMPGQAMRKGEVYKWRKELEPDNIHLFIAEQMPKVYKQLAENIKDRKDNAGNEGETKYWANVERNFRIYTSKLGNDMFQNGIVKQSQYKFRQRGFAEELDSYEDVIGVGNGVLKIGIEPQLYKSFHEYKISKFTETDYVPFDPENPYVKTLLNAFGDIFIENDVLEFKLFHASTGLDAREASCMLLLEVGGGQNGKTFFEKMLHNTIGNQYCAVGKSALLTAPIERGESANSAQMQMKDKRYFYFDEFNKCEVLNTARIKAIVNPGWQSGRDLNQRQSNFKNTSNPVALSNFDFIIDTTDHGTWRRIRYYRNKVKFCANPNPNNIYERKVNPKFMDEYTNDPLYKQAMLSILVHYYQRLCAEYGGNINNVPCPTIDKETEEFRNRQDALNRFITQMVVKSPTADAVGMATLASKYIEWYIRNIKPTNQTIVDVQSQLENSRIAAYFERRISGNMFLIGHRVKDHPDEDLLEGEESLSVKEVEVKYNTACAQSVSIPTRAQRAHDDFYKDLIINAKTGIQNTKETDNIDTTDPVLQLLSLI